MAAVAQLTPSQQRWRGRVEAGIRLVAPLLDVILAVGDRISRAVDRDTGEQPLLDRLAHDDRPALADGSR